MVYCVAFSGVKSDTSYISGGSYTERLHTPAAGVTRANIDTSYTRHATADSATIPVLKGNVVVRGAVTADSATIPVLKGNVVVRGAVTADSATIPVLKGNVTFRGYITGQDAVYDSTDHRVITSDSAVIPVADIDSFVGDVKVGGDALINGAITLKNSVTVSGVASEVVSEGPFIVLQSPTTSDYSIMQQTLDGIGFYTFSDIHYWDLRMRLSGAGNLTVAGTVTAPSLQLGTGDLLSVYDTGSFACTTSVSEGFTTQKIGSIRYTIIGDVVTMEIDGEFMGTSNSNLWLLRTGIPSHLLPTKETYSPVGMVMDNGVWVAASVCLYLNTNTDNDSLIVIIPTGGTGIFTASGPKGFNGLFPNSKTCWTYKK